MKQRFNKLLALVLTASLCMPMLPAASVSAASNVTYTDAETITLSTIGTERSTLMNEGWKFFLGNADGAQAVDFNDASWESIDLPHDFSITQDFTSSGEAESGFLPGGTGWYRKTVTIPDTCAGKTIVLNFDGSYKDTYLYVNGTLIGENHYGYNNFAFDITDYVTCDGSTENIIAVKVVNQLPSSRWYSGSGIYRDVNMIVTDPIHVELDGTAVVTPNIADGDGTVVTTTEVKNDSSASASVTVSNTVYEKGGDAVTAAATETVTVAAGETKEVDTTNVVTVPKLWSIDDPNQYTVVTELKVDGKVVDTYESDFGFRWFSFNGNNGFSLNGENVKLNGVCMHHDQGALGSAAYYDALYRQLSTMKDMGVNSIRITHNPGAEIYAEICDELGLLVIEELFDGWSCAKNGNSKDFSVYFSQKMTSDNQILFGDSELTWSEFATKTVVRRDRNNASVMLWSICNEVQEGVVTDYSNYPQISLSLIAMIKSEDSTREATIGDNTRYGNSTINQVVDNIVASGGVAGFNYGSGGSTYDSLHNSFDGFIASETASHINSRGIYMSQSSGANADGKYHLTSYDTSCVGWGKTAHDSMWYTFTRDFVYGQYVWTGFDYIGEPTPWNGTGSGDGGRGAIPNSSYFGIVETTGFAKDNYYLYRSQWNQDETTLHLVTAWDSDNMMYKNGQTPVVVYSNAPKVELYRDDTLIGTATRKVNTTAAGHTYYTYTVTSNNSSICTAENGSEGTSLYSTFYVTYTAGTISAKAYDENGNEIPADQLSGTTAVSTPDAVAVLDAYADKTEIAADGSSLSYITIDVTDENGNLDTTATNEITLTLTGDGEIAGVDNGDQATTKKYQQDSVLFSTTSAKINAYAGKALVIVRSTNTAGSFTLKATASGLSEDTVTVATVSESGVAKEATSYHMVKHFYAPAGTAASAIQLPVSAEVSFSDGTAATLPISWKSYDAANLRTLGTFRIYGTINTGSEVLDVFVTAHMYGDITAADNYSGITAPGVLPTLPTAAMTYFSDGTAFEAFPVTWDTSKITADDLKVGNTFTVTGTLNALGTTLTVTASIRVDAGTVESYSNVAPVALHLVDNGPYSDTLSSVIDESRPDNGWGTSRWTTWDKRNDSTFTEDATITMDWATAIQTNQILLFYYKDSSPQSAFPTGVKFEYALQASWDGSDIVSTDWKEIGYTQDDTVITVSDKTTGYTFNLDETINPVAIRISLSHDPLTFIGLNEIEIMSPKINYTENTSAKLEGISINGTALAGFDGTKTEYTVSAASIDTISFTNPQNAAVTVIPVSYNKVNVVSVSEDGKETITYTLNLPNAVDPTIAQRAELQNALSAVKALDASQYTAESYAKLQAAIAAVESSMATASSSQLKALLAELEAAKASLVKASGTTITTPTIKAGDTVTAGKVQYKVLDAAKKTVAVVKGLNKNAKKVTVPATVTVNGVSCTVVEIGANAFKGMSKLKSVVIGANVTKIGKKAFFGCKKLNKVTFKGTAVKTIKSGAFKNTGSKMKVIVPKKLKGKQRTAFKKKLTNAGMSKKLKMK